MVNSAEQDWRQWGSENPFFGVLAERRFLNGNLNEKALDEFFASGEEHVKEVYSVIHTKIRQNFSPNRVLDFGCGVGRLVIPFAQRAQVVVGIDVSPGMLAEAEKNCRERDVPNVQLLSSADLDTLASNSFDLVHSFIVFQHIPVAQGERLLKKLVGLIASGGIGAIHLTFSDVRPKLHRAVLNIRSRSRIMHGFFNMLQKRPLSWPHMQMNSYSMNRVFDSLFDLGCSNLHVEFTDHGGFRGTMLYFERTK